MNEYRKTEVKCSCCNKILFTTSILYNNRGKLPGEVRQRGFVVKLPFLYGHNRFEFFCNKKCWEKWFGENITKEAEERGDIAFSQLTKRLQSEEFSKSCKKRRKYV